MDKYDLNDSKVIEGFQNELKFIITNNEVGKAHDFYFYLEKLLALPEVTNRLPQDLVEFYERMVIKAKFIALPILKENDIYDLLSKNFDKIFGIEGYDIKNKLEHYLLTLYSLEARDNFKVRVRKILSASQIRITKEKISLDNKEVTPTIGNWLNDFRSQFGEEGFTDAMKLSQYLASNKNIAKLSAREKGNIDVIFNLYQRLKLSSLTKEGLEETIPVIKPDGQLGVIKQGKYEAIDKRTKDVYQKIAGVLRPRPEVEKETKAVGSGVDELKKLASEYPPGSLERKAVEEEIAKLEAGIRNKE